MAYKVEPIVLRSFEFSRRQRAQIRDALKVQRLSAEYWQSMRQAAARYRRGRDQDRSDGPKTERNQKLQEIATLTREIPRLLAELRGMLSDDVIMTDLFDACIARRHSILDFQKIESDLLDVEEIIHSTKLAEVANMAATPVPGRPPTSHSLLILIADMARVWTDVTGQRVTIDRPKETGRVPTTKSFQFFEIVLGIIDPDVTPQQLSTAANAVRMHQKLTSEKNT